MNDVRDSPGCLGGRTIVIVIVILILILILIFMSKFQVGDQVKVVNYGSLVWPYNEPPYDIHPELVGEVGIIATVDGNSYAIDGIPGKHAWYDDGQLELVVRPEYR